MANENIISENYYGVPTEGSEVKSMGNEIEVPDYVENVKAPNFLSLAAFAYKTGNRFLKGQEIDPEDVETLVKDAESKDVAKIAYNVVTGPSRLVTDSAQYLVDKFYPEKSEDFEDLAIKMFGKSAKQIGTLTGYDKEDIIDSETGKAQPVESTTGLVLDIGTLFASGIGIYNLADKAKILQNTKLTKTGQKWVNRIIKGDLSFAGASQLFNNPDNTVANIVQDTEFAKKDTVFADIINYLATDKEDSEMKKRASLLVQDLTIGVTFSTALATIGVSAKAAMNFAKQRFNKKITALTTGEQKTFTDEILVEMRKAVETVEELPVIIQEETSEGLKQITAQALGNKEIIKIAPTLLYRTKQRYLTTRGFNTPLINDAYQMTRRNIRMRTNIAYNTTTKLEQNINSYINEYTPSTDLVIKGASPTVKNPLTDIIKALRVNFKNLKIPEDGKVDYLNKTFNFSTDLSKSVLESRALITNLSKEFLEVGDNDELIREVITSDLESYMNTSYKLYEQGSWTPPSKVVTAAQRHLEDIYIEENFYGVNRLDLSQKKLDEAAASAAIDIDKILNKDKEAFNSFLSNRQKINESILKGKQFISPEIRALMGEYDSPSQNVLTTASKLIDLIENTRFFNTVANLGAKRPRYPALWEEATNKARQGLKASLDFEELKLKYNMDIPEKQFVVFDNGSKVGEVLKKTKKGLYEVEFKSVTGGKKVVTKAAKDLEIVLDNKLLKAFTEFEYEKIASKRPFVQSGSFVNSEDTLYTKPTYLFKQNESPPKGFRTPIQNTGSVLDDGYFTTPEIAKSLEGMQETFLFSRLVHGSKAVQIWRRGKGLLQKNKTVLDPTTQVRNGIGGTQFMMGNGWYPFKNGKVAFDVVINQIKNLQNQDLNLMYNYWQKEGIANTSLAMGDIEALFKNSDGQTTEEFTVKLMQRIENVTNKMGLDISKRNEVGTKWYDGTVKKIDSVANDPLVLPQKIYAEVDNFFKFATWFSELDVLVKANPTRSLKANMDEASQIVRNNLPNYDLVPPGFKALKDTPLGNFVSFTPELIRTSSHILERSFLEMGSKNPITLKRGLARLSGYSLLAGAWLGAPYFVAQQTGVSEELSDAIQVITEAPWSRKHNKIVFRWGDKLYYLDPTYLNPYDYFQSVAHTVLADYHIGKFNGDSAQDLVYNAIVDTIGQSLRFAHEESIGLKFVRYLNHAYYNDDGTDPDGNSIFAKRSQRTVENVLADGLKYTLKTAGPGVISDAEDQYLASTKTPNRSTGEIKNPMLKIIEFFTGFSFKEINVDAMLQRKVSSYASQVNFKLPTVNAGHVNEEGRDKEFKKFFNDVVTQQATKLEADQELYRQLIAFEKIPTYGKLRISKVLKERGVNISQDTLNSIFEGKFKSKFPSPEKLKEAKKKIGNHEGFFYLEKYLEGINNTNLSPQVDLEFAGLTKDAITAIKSGKRIFESFYTGSYERIKNRINQSDFSGSKYFPPSREERATGGVVDVPNAPDEPDERIDKLTGLPYNAQAGEAYMDKEDPLRRLGFASGGEIDPLARLGFGQGSIVGTVKEAAGSVFKTLKKLVTKSSAVDVSKGGKYLGTESKTRFNADLATRIIAANKNVPFVKRMTDTNDPNYTSSISMEGGKATHAMADRGAFVYPTIFVNSKTNKLERLEDSAAWKRAKETGEFIEFNTEEQAQWFARNNYKKAKQVKQFFNNFNLAQKDKVLNTLKTFGTGDIRPDLKVEAIDPPVETFGTGDIRPEIKVNADDLTANMLNVFEYTLADSKNPRIMELTKEERKGYAKFLTAQALHESERFNEESGTFNYSGRKATQAQIKAGKAREVGTYEMVDGHRVDTRGYFTDFSSLDDFATKQVNYLNRQFPKFFKAKTYDQAIAALFKGENNGVYATDMFKNVINFPDIKENIIDTNPLTNQYSIKVANYLGHGNEGFLTPKPRPDMNIIKKKNAQGKYNEAWVTSPIGKEGTLTSRRGINNKQYINQDLYNELVPNEATIIGQEKER